METAVRMRSLRQLVGPVGHVYLGRALPPGWLWGLLTLVVGVAAMAELPAAAAAMLIASAVVVHWARRRRPSLGPWRAIGLAALAVLAWSPEPDLLAQTVEHGVALVLLALALASAISHVVQARRLSRRLQHEADALDEQRLLALLPDDAATLARRWKAGDDSHADELAVVMHLTVMHAALRRRGTP